MPLPPVLRKEITVPGQFTATLPIWASLGTTFLATLFYIIAYSSIGWGYVEIDGRDGKIINRFGLWQTCHNAFGCKYWTTAELPAALRAVQAFATIALVFILFCVLLTVLYIFILRTQKVISICFMLAACHALSFMLLLITLSIFGARWRDSWPSSAGYRTAIAYSVALAIVALLLEVASTGLVGLEALSLRSQAQGNPRQQQRQQGPAVTDMRPPAANYAEQAGPSGGKA